MKRYIKKIEKHFPKNYFKGVNSYKMKKYTIKRKRKEIITFSEIADYGFGCDVLDIIIKYVIQMEPEKSVHYLKKTLYHVKKNLKSEIYHNCHQFPRDIIKHDWNYLLNKIEKQEIKKIEKYCKIDKFYLKKNLYSVFEEFLFYLLKSIFINKVGNNKLIRKSPNNQCRCGHLIIEEFLNRINHTDDNDYKSNHCAPNYFDIFFYENDMSDLFYLYLSYHDRNNELDVRNVTNLTRFIRIEKKLIKSAKEFNYRPFYSKLVSRFST